MCVDGLPAGSKDLCGAATEGASPMEMSSPYAQGSSVPPNIIGLSVETLTITYCAGQAGGRQYS